LNIIENTIRTKRQLLEWTERLSGWNEGYLAMKISPAGCSVFSREVYKTQWSRR